MFKLSLQLYFNGMYRPKYLNVAFSEREMSCCYFLCHFPFSFQPCYAVTFPPKNIVSSVFIHFFYINGYKLHNNADCNSNDL